VSPSTHFMHLGGISESALGRGIEKRKEKEEKGCT